METLKKRVHTSFCSPQIKWLIGCNATRVTTITITKQLTMVAIHKELRLFFRYILLLELHEIIKRFTKMFKNKSSLPLFRFSLQSFDHNGKLGHMILIFWGLQPSFALLQWGIFSGRTCNHFGKNHLPYANLALEIS